MKKLKRLIIYLRLWFIRQMGYNLPSLREATCIVPVNSMTISVVLSGLYPVSQ